MQPPRSQAELKRDRSKAVATWRAVSLARLCMARRSPSLVSSLWAQDAWHGGPVLSPRAPSWGSTPSRPADSGRAERSQGWSLWCKTRPRREYAPSDVRCRLAVSVLL